MMSCSVGDFAVKGYLAGRYVFSGEGLVADANTVSVFGVLGGAVSSANFKIKNIGGSFVNQLDVKNYISSFYKQNTLQSVFIGDPTLRLKQNVPKTLLNISLSNDTITFNCTRGELSSPCSIGCVSQQTSINVFNSGNNNALIYVDSALLSVYEYYSPLLPGEQRTIILETNLCYTALNKGESFDAGVILVANTEQEEYKFKIVIKNN